MRDFAKFHKMLFQAVLKIIVILVTIFTKINCQEEPWVIDIQRPASAIDDHFISFNLDSTATISNLLTRLPPSSTAKLLSPALVRVKSLFASHNSYPPLEQWKALNAWFHEANLTPIYLLRGNLSYKRLSHYVEANFQNNFTCYWELNPSDEMTKEAFKNDLMTLERIWDHYPSMKKYLKVVTPNYHHSQSLKRIIKQLNYSSDTLINENTLRRTHKGNPAWFNPINQTHPLAWIKQQEDAAKAGFTTVFHTETVEKLFSNIPVFWMSLLHKNVIGSKVLQVRSKPENSSVHLYIHCSKASAGSLSVIAINEGFNPNVAALKIPLLNSFVNEVEFHILTFSDDAQNDTITFINGLKVDLHSLPLKPKVEFLLLINNTLTLRLPERSVGFFTILGTQIQACFKKDPVWADVKVDRVLMSQAKRLLNSWVKTSEAPTIRITSKATTIKPTNPVKTIKREKRGINMELLRQAAEEIPYHHEHKHRSKSNRHAITDVDGVDDRMDFMMGADLNRVNEREKPSSHGHNQDLDLEDTISKISRNLDRPGADKYELKNAVKKLEHLLSNDRSSEESEEYSRRREHSRRFKRDLFGGDWQKKNIIKVEDNSAKQATPDKNNNDDCKASSELKASLNTKESSKEKSRFKAFFLLPNLIDHFEALKSKRREKRREHFEKILGFSKDGSNEGHFNRRKRGEELKNKRNIERNLRSISSKLRRDEVKKRFAKLNDWIASRRVKRSYDLTDNVIEDEGRVKGDVIESIDLTTSSPKTTVTLSLATTQVTSRGSTKGSRTKIKKDESFFVSMGNSVKRFFSDLYHRVTSYFR